MPTPADMNALHRAMEDLLLAQEAVLEAEADRESYRFHTLRMRARLLLDHARKELDMEPRKERA